MPTYDYLCGNCAHAFEKFQSITAPTLKKCPECGKMQLQRLIGSGAGIIFKGSGFYETDYRSRDYKKAKENEKPKTEAKDKKDTSTPETKTQTKPAKDTPQPANTTKKKDPK